MVAVLVWIVAGALCATAGPWLLRGMGWQVAHPVRALRLWFGLFLLGIGALLGSVIVATIEAVTATRASGSVAATVAVLGGWVLLATFGAVIVVVSHHAQPLVEGQRISGTSLLLLIARNETRRLKISGAEVSVVDAPTAFAVAGRDCDADVVISQPLVDAMTPAELRSVVHHELGHLRGHHALLRTIAQVAESLAPRARCGNGFASAVHLLSELAADDCAARSCGPQVAASALNKLAVLTDDPGPGMRARRLIRKSEQPSPVRSRAAGRPLASRSADR